MQGRKPTNAGRRQLIVPPKRGFFPTEPYSQPSPGLAGLCSVHSPPERQRAVWQPMPRSGRPRLLHKHSSCSHTFSKGHGASFIRAERGGSGWSTQLLVYPPAIPTAPGVPRLRSPPARFCSTWHGLPADGEPPEQPGFPTTPSSPPLLPFGGALREGRAGGSLHGALQHLQPAGEPPAATSCRAQTFLLRSGAAPGNHRASAVFVSPLFLPLKSTPTHKSCKRKELEASALAS